VVNAAWQLFIVVLGWLIGWAALRNTRWAQRWALLPGLLSAGLIAVQPWDSTFGQVRGYEGWPAVLVTLAIGAALLAWVPRLPALWGRVTASVLAPLLVLHVLRLTLTFFISAIG
jgi:hypothetical protein